MTTLLTNINSAQPTDLDACKSLVARKFVREALGGTYDGSSSSSSGGSEAGRQLEASARVDYRGLAAELLKSRRTRDGVAEAADPTAPADLIHLAKAIQVHTNAPI